jgi:hypothetical protein
MKDALGMLCNFAFRLQNCRVRAASALAPSEPGHGTARRGSQLHLSSTGTVPVSRSAART